MNSLAANLLLLTASALVLAFAATDAPEALALTLACIALAGLAEAADRL